MEKVVPSVERLHRGGLAVDKTTMAFAPPAPRPLYVTGDCIMAPARPARRWPLLVVVLVTALLAVAGVAFGLRQHSPFAGRELVRNAASQASSGTARVDMALTLTGVTGQPPLEIVAAGDFDMAGQRASLAMSIPGAGEVELRELGDD